MKKVTVVIPNYKGKKYLKPCVESVYENTEQELDMIIVDNASGDGSMEEIQENFPDVTCVMLDRNYGFCHAVNVGISKAKTPYVFLLNNDTLVCRHAIDFLVAEMESDEKIFSVEAKMIQYQDRTKIDSAGTFYNALGWAYARGKDKSSEGYRKRTDTFCACGGAAIYRKSVIDEIGDFDETHFAYLEDVDIGYRAKIFGCRNAYEPKARIIHVGSASSGSRHNDFKVHLSARNNVYLIYKNMPPLQVLINIPFLLAGFLIKFLFFLKKGMGKSYLKGLAEAPVLMKKEKRVRYQKKNFGNYLKIQIELWINILRLFL